MLLFPFSEEMREVFVVELRETLPVVDGFADHEHRGKRQVVVVNHLGEVLQLATINLLVWPGEMIAGGNGRVFRIFLKEFPLHIVHDSCAEEDAHCALAPGQEVQLLPLRHGCSAFATREDDGLCPFGDGELTLQFGCCSEEGGDARRDVVGHPLLVEERHLLLNSAEDAGVARVQTDDEVPFVVVFLHQFTLLLQVHVG